MFNFYVFIASRGRMHVTRCMLSIVKHKQSHFECALGGKNCYLSAIVLSRIETNQFSASERVEKAMRKTNKRQKPQMQKNSNLIMGRWRKTNKA